MGLNPTVLDPNGVLRTGASVALVVGNFDGVHLGHQRLLAELAAGDSTLQPVALTFEPHPNNFFRPFSLPMLSTVFDRSEMLLAAGAKAVAICHFDEAFAKLSPEAFLDGIGEAGFLVRRIVVGHDFRFGFKRQGDFEFIRSFGMRHGWEVQEFAAVSLDGEIVSSSVIRKQIHDGNVDLAERFLGRRFSLPGRVVKGDQRGRHIGFPTVNLLVPGGLIRPKSGVYAGYVRFKNKHRDWPAVMNFGYRPTFGDQLEFRAEAHILDFSDDVYGQEALFLLKKFIRSEMKFSGVDALVKKIGEDVLEARAVLREEA